MRSNFLKRFALKHALHITVLQQHYTLFKSCEKHLSISDAALKQYLNFFVQFLNFYSEKFSQENETKSESEINFVDLKEIEQNYADTMYFFKVFYE